MKQFFGSLLFKVGASIIVAQVLILSILGAYYINRFSQEIENRIEAQIQIPGALMNNGLLNYEAISQRDTMEKIVGGDLRDAMVIGFNRTVFQSIDPADTGKSIADITRFQQELLSGNPNDQVFIRDEDEEGSYMASITPVYSASGKAPFLFAYIKIGTNELESQKTQLRIVFFLGSLFSAAMSSAAVLLAFQFVVLSGIKKLTKASQLISQDHLDESVVKELPVGSDDEIGTLSKSFAQMTVDLKKSRGAIEEYSKGLEQIVTKRTEELEKSKQELTSKVTELERLNKTMVGRELKMLELKNRIKQLEGQPGMPDISSAPPAEPLPSSQSIPLSQPVSPAAPSTSDPEKTS